MVWFTRIDHDNLVCACIIVIFVKCKKLIDPEIGVHGAYAIEKNKWTTVIIILRDMAADALVNILHEVGTMSISRQCILYISGLRWVCLFFFQLIFQHGRMTEKLLVIKKLAELIKEIECEHIHIVGRTNEVSLKFLDLLPNGILLLGRILKNEEVIKQISILSILEFRAVEQIVKFLDGHSSCFLMLSIS